MAVLSTDPLARITANSFCGRFDQEALLAGTGVNADIFSEFYGKYHASIGSPLQLYRALSWMKLYPPKRALSLSVGKFGGKGSGYMFARAKEVITRLAGVVQELSVEDYGADWNQLPLRMFPEAKGMIDSVPVYVESRKSTKRLNTKLFSGKYHDTCLKFMVETNLFGVPTRFSGPFAGRRHDASIFRDPDNLPIPAGVKLLGDLGFVGCGANIITPHKRTRKVLTYNEWMYNRTHSWFRSVIEHTFAYLKRYAVLACAYNGDLNENGLKLLFDVFTVIVHISAMALRKRPLRRWDSLSMDRLATHLETGPNHRDRDRVLAEGVARDAAVPAAGAGAAAAPDAGGVAADEKRSAPPRGKRGRKRKAAAAAIDVVDDNVDAIDGGGDADVDANGDDDDYAEELVPRRSGRLAAIEAERAERFRQLGFYEYDSDDPDLDYRVRENCATRISRKAAGTEVKFKQDPVLPGGICLIEDTDGDALSDTDRDGYTSDEWALLLVKKKIDADKLEEKRELARVRRAASNKKDSDDSGGGGGGAAGD